MELAKVRNIGVVAHIDAGKTTVTERILFYTGVEHRIGEVHDGTATMDWMAEERERGITITAAATTCVWQDHFLQIIDTPGHVDFTVEVERSLRVLDSAIVVLDAVAGVQPQTETVLRQANRHSVPLLLFVNKMDRLGACPKAALESVRERLKLEPIAVQMPVGAGDTFDAVVDLVAMKLLKWQGEQGQDIVCEEVPAELRKGALHARDSMCAQIAEVDEDLTDAYLETGTLTEAQVHAALRMAVRARAFVPVLFGAALRNMGVQPVLDAVVKWMPSPLDRPPVIAHDLEGAELQCLPDSRGPLVALVFKIFHEKYGDLHYLRIYSGTLKERQRLVVARTGRVERVGRILRMHAEHREQLAEAGPGAIVAVSGLKFAQTGDSLCVKGEEVTLEPMTFPEAVMEMTVESSEPGQAERLMDALEFLDREDPTLRVGLDEDTGQALLSGMGELHLEVVLHRLEQEFGVKARTGRPQVSYREAVLDSAEGEATLEIPGDDGAQVIRATISARPCAAVGVEFVASEIWQALPRGILADLPDGGLGQEAGPLGFPLTGVALEVIALSWNPEEKLPNSQSIVGALSRALRQALKGRTELREPVMTAFVRVPESFMSGVLSDLSARGGEIEGINLEVGEISAKVPLAEMFAYATKLRSLTQGKGEFVLEPAGFAAPSAARMTAILNSMGLY